MLPGKSGFPVWEGIGGTWHLQLDKSGFLAYYWRMFSDELKKLLLQVISSWQVWAVTGVLVVYILLVNSVARIYHRRPRRSSQPPLPKAKPEPAEAPGPTVSPSDSDELDLEEEDEAK